jgi:serine O-acetyltransferase
MHDACIFGRTGGFELLHEMTKVPRQGRESRICATEPDWTREACRRGSWDPGKALLKSIRDYQRAQQGKFLSGLRCRFAILRHRFWSIATGAEIPINARIGGGLKIPHPNGIVIHPKAVIGPNCLIFQQVTIGARGRGVPTIGGHVDIGAGAKIIGAITIGDHARIGANALVIRDVPPGETVVSAPAVTLAEARAPFTTE